MNLVLTWNGGLMNTLTLDRMNRIRGGAYPAGCTELSAAMWFSIGFGQPEVAAGIWLVMLGKGCFNKT